MDLLLFFQTLVDGVLIGGIYSLIAIGLTLIFGVMKIINFAQGALMMLGMYVTYWSFTIFGIGPYLSIPISAAVLFLLGCLIQRGVLAHAVDAPEHNQLLITFGIMLIISNGALILFSADFRTVSAGNMDGVFSFGDISFNKAKLVAFLCASILTIILYWFLRKTRIGKAIRGTSNNREGAALQGIKVKRIDMITFGIGSALAAISGSLITPFLYITPTVGDAFILKAFVVVVLGGLGSFFGALIGGIIIGVGESLTSVYLPLNLKELATYIIFIFILLYRPIGIFGGRSK